MELIATSRRDGEPVACAYGAVLEEDGTVFCGLLLMQSGVQARTLTFRSPQTRERVRLAVPEKFRKLRAPAFALNVTLEDPDGPETPEDG